MKRTTFLIGNVCMLSIQLLGQQKVDRSYRNFPIIVSIQFHSLNLPFKKLKSNFSNMGIGIGTEVSYNGGQSWVQQFNVCWYRNKNIGNGLSVNTQTVWRPAIVDNVYSELKIGVGYHYCFRPVESFKPLNGEWLPVHTKGKGMLAIITGVSLGYSRYSSDTYVSPFVSYQWLLLKGYNKSVPIVPETLIQIGSRIHL